jgi:hypothetical protein
MEREYPEQDTGKIELQRIINCMKDNKYEYTDSLDAGKFTGCYNVNFVKEIKYSDKEGAYINDRRIKVTIEFDTSFDYKNEYIKDRNDDFEYSDENADKAHDFIQKIIDNTYDDVMSKKGGQRKKTRKTKKKIIKKYNKKSIFKKLI